jgi:hypothetical protein
MSKYNSTETDMSKYNSPSDAHKPAHGGYPGQTPAPKADDKAKGDKA